MTDTKLAASAGGAKASSNPRTQPHYVAVLHPFVSSDLQENNTIATAWSRSDINRLYNSEVGEWNSIRFCASNMVPAFVGVTAIEGSATTAGSLATGTYYIQVTASDTQNQYETRIYGVSSGISVTGPNGSVDVILPSVSGYTFNVYLSTDTTPANLGLSTAGPTSGPMQGQATQLTGGQTVTITALGTAQVPPAAPANGVTVYPTFVFGRGAYGQVMLDNVKFTYLKEADKSDPLNQLRVVGWKCYYGTLIENQTFFMRIESTSAFNSTFG